MGLNVGVGQNDSPLHNSSISVADNMQSLKLRTLVGITFVPRAGSMVGGGPGCSGPGSLKNGQ